jgi:3-oxoacyl-[acyl-carrier-protein] synthase II
MGAVSPYGKGVDTFIESLIEGKSAITSLSNLADIKGLRSWVAGLVIGIDPKEIPRKYRRSMSSMSIYATMACREALDQARLNEEQCTGGQMGVAIGSTIGSTLTTQEFFNNLLSTGSLEQMKSTVFFKIMNHSCAANVSQILGITGRTLSPSAACSTSCQAIGYGYEMIAFGKQDFMLCGGTDEYHPTLPQLSSMINPLERHAPSILTGMGWCVPRAAVFCYWNLWIRPRNGERIFLAKSSDFQPFRIRPISPIRIWPPSKDVCNLP